MKKINFAPFILLVTVLLTYCRKGYTGPLAKYLVQAKHIPTFAFFVYMLIKLLLVAA